jgi:hypothetical protein
MKSEFDQTTRRPTDPGQPVAQEGEPAATSYESPPGAMVTYTYNYTIPTPLSHFSFSHDTAMGRFIVTNSDGTAELFRDKPLRYLVVEPDPNTGELRPAAKHGRPVYLYLCREDRES